MSNCHEIRTVRCAACGRVRQEVSHWFVVSAKRGLFRCSRLAAKTFVDHGPLQLGRGLRKYEQPVCGQQCAQKLFERYLAGEAARQHGWALVAVNGHSGERRELS